MKAPYSNRKYVINIIILFIGIVFILRLFYLQVIDDDYKVSANNNALRLITDFPARGLVYDRNGKLLVYNEATYDLMVIPQQVKNIDTTAFCKLIGISKAIFISRMTKAKKYSRYAQSIFDREISKETYGYIQEKLYQFHGFTIQARTLRKYPLNTAAHTLGYIGEVGPEIIINNRYYKSGDYIGASGIEKSYEVELRGKKGMKIMMVDAFNREKGSFRDGMYDTVSVAGKDLFTTLDAELQIYGEKLMSNKNGSIVAIEPQTGEILALVSSPAYDPNLLAGRDRSKNYFTLLNDKKNKPLYNRALMAQYPPGSTFKILNALIGEQLGVINVDTRFPCSLGFHMGNVNVKCHNHPSPCNLEESIQHSCNSYYSYTFKAIIEKSGYKSTREAFNKWRQLAMTFGFGKKYFNDLPNELSGNIPTPEHYDKLHGKNRWRALSIISIGIGQGEILVTPLQLANFTAILANKGYYFIPHIVKGIGKNKIIDKKFTTKQYASVDSKYFEPVLEGMFQVVEAGTGRGAKVEKIKMGGKTGTAQNPHGEDHSIFILIAPMDNPKIVVSVIVENGGWGATWAVPIASLMVEKYLYGKVKREDLEKRMMEGKVYY
ncbi:MAG: penicillin-binding protein 2 [Bacteroidetes bacterium]|nr:penicillin-binding protein 2 [Bacteroidota bacterium]